jgi:hypothetical protein
VRTASPLVCGLFAIALAPEIALGAPAPPAAPVDRPAASAAKARRSPFDTPVAARNNPYGPRPSGVPKLSREQVLRYALQNPAIEAAGDQVEAMRARLGKAKLAWLPIIDTSLTLSPGVFIQCDDIQLDNGSTNGFDFQFCRPDDEADVQTIQGYFSQLNKAGVRVNFNLDALFPIYTFGKIKNAKLRSCRSSRPSRRPRCACTRRTRACWRRASRRRSCARPGASSIRPRNAS